MPQPPCFADNSWQESLKNGNVNAYQRMQCGYSAESSVTGAASPRRMPLVPISQSLSGSLAPSPPWLQLTSKSPHRRTLYSPSPECTSPVYQRLSSPPLVDSNPQWVLPDIRPDSSPEVLHLCENCDAEFNTVFELTCHARLCGKIVVKPQPKPSIRPKQKILTLLKVNSANAVPAKLVPTSISKPRPPSKESFFEGLGLASKNAQKRTKIPVKSQLPSVTTSFRFVPFTHLPHQLRLRNNSTYASTRAEAQNLDAIENNWKRVDRACAAYPANHKRFQDFSAIRPKSTVRTLPNKAKKVLLGAQALALKRSLRQPRLLLMKLTVRDIRQASKGLNTEELLLKYAPRQRKVRRPAKKSLPPAVPEKMPIPAVPKKMPVPAVPEKLPVPTVPEKMPILIDLTDDTDEEDFGQCANQCNEPQQEIEPSNCSMAVDDDTGLAALDDNVIDIAPPNRRKTSLDSFVLKPSALLPVVRLKRIEVPELQNNDAPQRVS